MNQGQYVFSQLVSHLGRNHFNYLVRKYDGNKYVKHFSCWNQLLAMMFGFNNGSFVPLDISMGKVQK